MEITPVIIYEMLKASSDVMQMLQEEPIHHPELFELTPAINQAHHARWQRKISKACMISAVCAHAEI